MSLWGLLLSVSCTNSIAPTVNRCEVELSTVEPETGRPGDLVVISGDGPILDERDSAVFVGGVRATVTQANGGTEDCERCIACRLEAQCSACDESCNGVGQLSVRRQEECFAVPEDDVGADKTGKDSIVGVCGRCTFSVEFEVPDLPPGETTVWTIGQPGSSRPVPFTVAAPPPGTGDTALTIP